MTFDVQAMREAPTDIEELLSVLVVKERCIAPSLDLVFLTACPSQKTVVQWW